MPERLTLETREIAPMALLSGERVKDVVYKCNFGNQGRGHYIEMSWLLGEGEKVPQTIPCWRHKRAKPHLANI